MKKYQILLIIGLLYNSVTAKAQTYLSEYAEISIITCSPGKDVYSVFGHSAIRINDPATGVDVVYNYGTFDFNQPGFYVNFVKGRLNYMLSKAPFNYFINEYRATNRSVYEQVLNLNAADKLKILNYLENNYLPENRFYLYDFLYDNCATRIRDVFEQSLGTEFKLDYTSLPEKKSYRELLKPYKAQNSWLDLGIDLAMGADADQIAPLKNYLLLPDYVQLAFEKASYKNTNLLKRSGNINNPEEIAKLPESFLSAYVLFWLLFVLIVAISIFELVKKKRLLITDRFVFGFVGIVGAILLFLWTGTDHKVMQNNYIVFWALPTHLIFAFFVRKLQHTKIELVYTWISGILAIIPLLFFFVYPQQLNFAVYPLLLAILLRCFIILKFHARIL